MFAQVFDHFFYKNTVCYVKHFEVSSELWRYMTIIVVSVKFETNLYFLFYLSDKKFCKAITSREKWNSNLTYISYRQNLT